ncbi:MAG TPA: mononuclear molybdenum enzyme YedY, partial [Chromatiales bacterium]|nr:mononuclear molybdenum enzyme YedY [Chromatiales bacterium]
MLIQKPADIRPSEITPEPVYHNRREFLRRAGLTGVGLLAGTGCSAENDDDGRQVRLRKLDVARGSPYSTDADPNAFEDIISYNNFYEFGLDKSDPARLSGDFRPRPWSVTIAGEANRTGTFDLDDFIAPHPIEERVYRLRCVEAWSMVVP